MLDATHATPTAQATAATPLRFWHYDHFPLPLPYRHRYPRNRFGRVRERAGAEGLLPAGRLHAAEPADWGLLELVHTPAYLHAVRTGELTRAAEREIGLPWSEALVARARAAVDATHRAAWHALEGGVGCVIGGGTHHAFPDRGAGYCLFSDIAVAARDLLRRHMVERVLIVDLDVHQGNGNAEIFARDPRVFTLSVHGECNWPYRKAASDLDVALPDGTGDEAYLAAVAPALGELMERLRPDVVFYQAGADPLACDRLGRLALTAEGLARRDRLVYQLTRDAHCPLVVTMGGGYGEPIEDTVAVHLNTLRGLHAVYGAPVASSRGGNGP